MVLKTEKCSFSGLRVYPGHGMRLTKQDSSTFLYLNGKCKKLAEQKKKPAKLAWTYAYRKAHKKVRCHRNRSRVWSRSRCLKTLARCARSDDEARWRSNARAWTGDDARRDASARSREA
jgi:ribosomal protein L24E